MNAKEFIEKFRPYTKRAGSERDREEKKQDIDEAVGIIRDFGQELINEVTGVLSGKVTGLTALIVSDILKTMSDSVAKLSKNEGMALFLAYKTAIKHESFLITMPGIEQQDDGEN